MKRADKIRNMTNDELAAFLLDLISKFVNKVALTPDLLAVAKIWLDTEWIEEGPKDTAMVMTPEAEKRMLHLD